MNLAVLSGKGGTGKTTVSTNLAIAMGANYVDCDAEEPNGFLFLRPDQLTISAVETDYPIIDTQKCIGCGQCVHHCQFHALARIGSEIMLFEDMCHSCGACALACDQQAISWGKRTVGQIYSGRKNHMACYSGELNIGEAMAAPILRQLLQSIPKENNILDCAPGTSCNVVNALKGADGAILVTEPTVFGLQDLKRAVTVVRMFALPLGVILNKDTGDNQLIQDYCAEEKIPFIGAIAYEGDIASQYAKGQLLYEEARYQKIFDQLASATKEVMPWI